MAAGVAARGAAAAAACALALGVLAPPGAAGSGADAVTLQRIASEVSERVALIRIEASEPVAYSAFQPDPQTFVVDLRDVAAGPFSDEVRYDPRHAVSHVAVERARADDGASLTRVRLALQYPQRPRLRSARNVIVVETDPADRRSGGSEAADTPGPPAVGRAVQVDRMAGSAVAATSVAARQGAPVLGPFMTQAAQQAPSAQAPAQPPSRYTGNPVTLDFQGADLRAVLRTFAEISGLNIVIDPTIQGSVDVALRDVPWDQALDIILRANRLGYSVDGTVVRIAPLTVLADEEAQRRKLAEEQALAGELRVLTRSLSYARAEDLRTLLTQTVLSQRGSIQTDPRTNTIIINDLSDRLDRANELITTLDRPEPQVEIEARIVQTTREFARRLGIQWGANAAATPALGNSLPLAFPNAVVAGGRAGASGSVVNLGVEAATTAAGLALGSINGALNLDVALSAIERSGQGRILSTPRVSTQNNVAAEITQGVQIPIQTIANNTVTVTFRDAALTLKVTPQITAANTVIMQINVENASPDFSRAVNNIPPIDTQRAITSVLVADGETTVIGGIYVSREQSAQDRTPGLHRVPLLGWLFKRDELSDESRELLIFITPRIMRLQ